MGEVASVGEIHGENFIAGLEDGEIDGGIRLGTGVRLDVGVVRSKEFLRALDGEGFHNIDVFAAAVPSFSRIPLSVFIGEERALRFHDGGRSEVFRGDELDVVPLAMLLADDGRVEFRIGNGDGAAGGFADTALVATALKSGGEKGIDHFFRSLDIRVFSGKAENIGVVVLTCGDGFLDIADVGGADVVEAIRGDAHANAGGAGENAEVKCVVGNVVPHDLRVVGIIHGICGMRAEILDFISAFAEVGDDGVFHFKSAMIGANGDAEWGIAHKLEDVRGLNAGKSGLQTGNLRECRFL